MGDLTIIIMSMYEIEHSEVTVARLDILLGHLSINFNLGYGSCTLLGSGACFGSVPLFLYYYRVSKRFLLL